MRDSPCEVRSATERVKWVIKWAGRALLPVRARSELGTGLHLLHHLLHHRRARLCNSYNLTFINESSINKQLFVALFENLSGIFQTRKQIINFCDKGIKFLYCAKNHENQEKFVGERVELLTDPKNTIWILLKRYLHVFTKYKNRIPNSYMKNACYYIVYYYYYYYK